MAQYSPYAGYNSGTTTFPNVTQNISSASQVIHVRAAFSYTRFLSALINLSHSHERSFSLLQKLDYSAYSSSLYGNDRVPLQYSGYYPMPGYHAPPTSFNIGNINFAGNLLPSDHASFLLAWCDDQMKRPYVDYNA